MEKITYNVLHENSKPHTYQGDKPTGKQRYYLSDGLFVTCIEKPVRLSAYNPEV